MNPTLQNTRGAMRPATQDGAARRVRVWVGVPGTRLAQHCRVAQHRRVAGADTFRSPVTGTMHILKEQPSCTPNPHGGRNPLAQLGCSFSFPQASP